MYSHFSRVLASQENQNENYEFYEEKILNDDSSESDYSSDSVDNSDIEFHLYSQVHYASNLGNEANHEPYASEDSAIKAQNSQNKPQEGSSQTSVDKSEFTESTGDRSTISKSGIDKNDITLLKYFLDADEEDFVPETWEIVDSVEESDSDDAGLDIHVSENKCDENSDAIVEEKNDAWTPGKGPKTCWKIDNKDKASFKLESKGRYYGDAPNSMRCRNCDEIGHRARDCPEGKKKPVCFMCGERGHIGRDCPERQNHTFAKRYTECNRCGQEGHIRVNCPDLWRQFHVTTTAGPINVPEIPVRLNNNVQCYNCASEGHFGHECEEPRTRMYCSVVMPLVYRYDEHAVVSEPQDLRKKLNRKERDNEPSFSTSKRKRKEIHETAAQEKRDRKFHGREQRTKSPKIQRKSETKRHDKLVKRTHFEQQSSSADFPRKSAKKIRNKQDSNHVIDEIWTKIRSDKAPKGTEEYKSVGNDSAPRNQAKNSGNVERTAFGSSMEGSSSRQQAQKLVRRDGKVNATCGDDWSENRKLKQIPGQHFEKDDVIIIDDDDDDGDVIVIDSTSGDDLSRNKTNREKQTLGLKFGNKQKIFDKKRKRSKNRSADNSPNPYLDFLNDGAPCSSRIDRKFTGVKRKFDDDDDFSTNHGRNAAKRRNFGKYKNNNNKKRRHDNRNRFNDDRGFRRRFK